MDEDNWNPWWSAVNPLRDCNSSGEKIPLLAYRSDNSWTPLTKSFFLNFTSRIFKATALEDVSGHSYQIGGSLELLLDGVAPEIVMKLGGWSSLCFLLYWQQLEKIIPLAISCAWQSQMKEFEATHNLRDIPADFNWDF
ncbi:hypothetical protein C8J56DRAFT_1050070 [Mycena floridula]|nr:hypothetical protein C8J56DRAFT_1050070 [Mycena floridula]